MKIIYISQSYFTDCDFPLIKELENKGCDVRYYIPIASFNLKSALLDLGSLYPHTGIFKAINAYPAFKIFENEINLDKVYVINKKHKQKFHPLNILLMLRFCFSVIFKNVDVVHITEEPKLVLKLLYLIKNRLVLTVHDPFMHSSKYTKKDENDRIEAFKKIRRLILLNEKQKTDFCKFYHIGESRIYLSKLGCYDTINNIPVQKLNVKKPFVLFFGGISKYKGLDLLMEAMLMVHEKHPELTLVVAGGGKLWFDINKYRNDSYFDLRLYYVSIGELSFLLDNCLFTICPYIDATQSGVVQTSLTKGAPCIVTNVGALSDVVINGKYGIVIEANSVTAIKDGINLLYENPSLLLEMKRNIKEEWIPSMNWSSIAEDYLKCYQDK